MQLKTCMLFLEHMYMIFDLTRQHLFLLHTHTKKLTAGGRPWLQIAENFKAAWGYTLCEKPPHPVQ